MKKNYNKNEWEKNISKRDEREKSYKGMGEKYFGDERERWIRGRESKIGIKEKNNERKQLWEITNL